jgi:hypothetical protein
MSSAKRLHTSRSGRLPIMLLTSATTDPAFARLDVCALPTRFAALSPDGFPVSTCGTRTLRANVSSACKGIALGLSLT